MNNQRQVFFNPYVDGLSQLLHQTAEDAANRETGFRYHDRQGLNILVHGSPGVGKTIFALQFAAAAARNKPKDGGRGSGYDVLYLTKDTSSEVLCDRFVSEFNHFGHPEPAGVFNMRSWDGVHDGNFVVFADFNENAATLAWSSRYEPCPSAFDAIQRLHALMPQEVGSEHSEEADVSTDKVRRLKIEERLRKSAMSGRLIVICDSLRPDAVEEHVRFRSASAGKTAPPVEQSVETKSQRETSASTSSTAKPGIFLFLMEATGELPDRITVGFPPDVHIRMDFRDDEHGLRTRTFQLLKTRFQKALDERCPFIICDEKNRTHALQFDATKRIAVAQVGKSSPDEKKLGAVSPEYRKRFVERFPGITLMPPLAYEPIHSASAPKSGTSRVLRSGIAGLDALTKDGCLDGGGCTLIVTESRCGSSSIGLHYLLAQIARAAKEPDAASNAEAKAQGGAVAGETLDPVVKLQTSATTQNTSDLKNDPLPRSVLYITFSMDFPSLLLRAFRHVALRDAVAGKDDVRQTYERLKGVSVSSYLQPHQRPGVHANDVLFHYPLSHKSALIKLEAAAVYRSIVGETATEENQRTAKAAMDAEALRLQSACDPNFFVYVPGYSWHTPEEALDTIARILHVEESMDGKDTASVRRHFQHIDRIVLDRVSRLQATWPLVRQSSVFVSGLASLCASRGAELILIEDTASSGESPGSYRSHWSGTAQNVLRLRRTLFHGNEARTVEMIRASAKEIANTRPQEILFVSDAIQGREEIRVEDSFRGYTGLFTPHLRRAPTKVELSYDAPRTPLYNEVRSIKQSIESTMDGVQVHLMGPDDWSGINSAFHNLSSPSRDACHVVAIDGVWLEELIRAGVLAELSQGDIIDIVPQHILQLMLKHPSVKGVTPVRTGMQASELGNINMAGQHRDALSHMDPEDFGKAFKRGYVTQSLALAANKMRNKGQKEDEHLLGNRFALPMRHNWGLMAVVEPNKQHFEYVFRQLCVAENGDANARNRSIDNLITDIIQGSQSKRVESVEDSGEAPSAAMKTVLRTLLGQDLEDNASELNNKIFQAIWKPARCESSTSALTWRELARYRMETWTPTFRGAWLERWLDELSARQPDHPDSWLHLFPRIDFFGLAITTRESLVALFLEVLLSETSMKEVFKLDTVIESNGFPIYHMLSKPGEQPSEASIEALISAVVLMYALLSQTQRRQIAIGLESTRHDIGPIRPARLLGATDLKNSPVADWPAQIALFTREWVSTVPDILPRFDVRRRVVLHPLPTGPAAKSFWRTVLDSDSDEQAVGRMAQACGPTVGGTWYLGILRGGNTLSGRDVMKTILSTAHERARTVNRSGGAVTREFYKQEWLPKDLPYADTISQIYRCSELETEDPLKDVAKHVFPFDRNQIHDYLPISMILYDMIRHVMSLDVGDDALCQWLGELEKEPLPAATDLLSKEPWLGFRAQCEELVEQAASRIRDLRRQTGASTGATAVGSTLTAIEE